MDLLQKNRLEKSIRKEEKKIKVNHCSNQSDKGFKYFYYYLQLNRVIPQDKEFEEFSDEDDED